MQSQAHGTLISLPVLYPCVYIVTMDTPSRYCLENALWQVILQQMNHFFLDASMFTPKLLLQEMGRLGI